MAHFVCHNGKFWDMPMYSPITGLHKFSIIIIIIIIVIKKVFRGGVQPRRLENSLDKFF